MSLSGPPYFGRNFGRKRPEGLEKKRRGRESPNIYCKPLYIQHLRDLFLSYDFGIGTYIGTYIGTILYTGAQDFGVHATFCPDATHADVEFATAKKKGKPKGATEPAGDQGPQLRLVM